MPCVFFSVDKVGRNLYATARGWGGAETVTKDVIPSDWPRETFYLLFASQKLLAARARTTCMHKERCDDEVSHVKPKYVQILVLRF